MAVHLSLHPFQQQQSPAKPSTPRDPLEDWDDNLLGVKLWVFPLLVTVLVMAAVIVYFAWIA